MTSSGIQPTEKAEKKQFSKAEYSGTFPRDSDAGFDCKLDVAGVTGTAGDSTAWRGGNAVFSLATSMTTGTLGLSNDLADEVLLLRCLMSVVAGAISALWLSCFTMLATEEEGTAADPDSERAKFPSPTCRMCTGTHGKESHVEKRCGFLLFCLTV